MYNHILITTDGSAHSEKSVEQGLNLAQKLNSKATIITVTSPYTISGLPGGWTDTQAFIDQYDQEWKDYADKTLNEAKQRADGLNIKVDTLHMSNISAADAILEASKQLGCDLIVMASHGRTGLKRMLLGSQTNEVINMSQVPVLVVR
ncbi:universal stress protein [Paenochrobactrum sp. BZR 588]|uniref:universal stress protein n=1 Tax=unclassified Paenochrobactrum TaxID=2639760 RepID=UPI003854C0C1